MTSLCQSIIRSGNRQFFIMAALVSSIMIGLVVLLFFIARVGNSQMQYSPDELSREDGRVYFPFGKNEQISWPQLKCPRGYFPCNSTMTCLELSRRCDGVVDCSNAEDELNCVCAFRMPPMKFCDKYPDCFDQSDESFCNYCPPDSFNCGNGKCVPRSNVCDSVLDCDNAMDENFCFKLSSDIGVRTVELNETSKTGFMLRNKNGIWYPICASRYDAMQETLASFACVSITANPLASSTHHQRHFQRNSEESSKDFVYHVYGRFVRWNGCLTDEGIFVTCDDFLCGFNPKLLLPRPQPRIVGGQFSEPGAWPWHAAIYKNGSYACGATLINAHWLITAAHCLLSWNRNYYEVQLGMLRRRSFTPHQKTYRIELVVPHHRFNIVTLDYDIALLKTVVPVSFNFWVRPICLPDPKKLETPGSFCTAIGWGDTGEKADDSDNLQEVHIPLTRSCRKPERLICAGYPEGGRDACQGDSGGPLMCLHENGLSWYIAGVISGGTGCARPGTPGMYTRVSYYLGWIADVIQNDHAIVTRPLSGCPGWQCSTLGGGNCLPPNKLCDGHVDCYDAQDEINCFSGKKRKL